MNTGEYGTREPDTSTAGYETPQTHDARKGKGLGEGDKASKVIEIPYESKRKQEHDDAATVGKIHYRESNDTY